MFHTKYNIQSIITQYTILSYALIYREITAYYVIII